MLLLRNRRYKNRLEHIWLSKRETKISLKHKKIEEINCMAFMNKKNLQEIILPDTLKRIIGTGAFYECYNLEKVTFNEGLKVIEGHTFDCCKSLKEVELPDSMTRLGWHAFRNCIGLEKVKLPRNIETIYEGAFTNCSALKEIIIPDKVKTINNMAFSDCYSLETIVLPSSLNCIHKDAFERCHNVNKVVIKDFKMLLEGSVKLRLNDKLKYCYLNEETNELIVTSYKCNLDGCREFVLSKGYSEEETLNFKIIKDVIYKDLKVNSIRMKSILNDFIRYNLNKDNFNDIKENILNYDKFVRMLKYIDKSLYNPRTCCRSTYSEYDLFKFAYALGSFSDNAIDRQRAGEFIKVIYDKNLLGTEELHASFESMQVNGFNKEFTEFIMNKDNFERLKWYERRQYGYISRIYNSFNDIKEFGRSNRGSQRYRKVTVDMCVDYFTKVRFSGVNELNEDISETIKQYTHQQHSFDTAVQIRNEFLELKEENRIDEHILKEELKELRKEIIEDTSSTLSNLNEISNNKFTYEYLSKYDPRNFILGKYCSCCAHLEGVGDGIMKASILHPDCQNLVIKDEKGNIVAKSTLYINREQGYGVFNNVEVNNNISLEDKELIYIKYIKAIEDFVNRYNELNENNPIKQINVGMNLNDLRVFIRKHNKEAHRILKGIDFSEYGSYEGDWKKEQYVVWKKGK